MQDGAVGVSGDAIDAVRHALAQAGQFVVDDVALVAIGEDEIGLAVVTNEALEVENQTRAVTGRDNLVVGVSVDAEAFDDVLDGVVVEDEGRAERGVRFLSERPTARQRESLGGCLIGRDHVGRIIGVLHRAERHTGQDVVVALELGNRLVHDGRHRTGHRAGVKGAVHIGLPGTVRVGTAPRHQHLTEIELILVSQDVDIVAVAVRVVHDSSLPDDLAALPDANMVGMGLDDVAIGVEHSVVGRDSEFTLAVVAEFLAELEDGAGLVEWLESLNLGQDIQILV